MVVRWSYNEELTPIYGLFVSKKLSRSIFLGGNLSIICLQGVFPATFHQEPQSLLGLWLIVELLIKFETERKSCWTSSIHFWASRDGSWVKRHQDGLCHQTQLRLLCVHCIFKDVQSVWCQKTARAARGFSTRIAASRLRKSHPTFGNWGGHAICHHQIWYSMQGYQVSGWMGNRRHEGGIGGTFDGIEVGFVLERPIKRYDRHLFCFTWYQMMALLSFTRGWWCLFWKPAIFRRPQNSAPSKSRIPESYIISTRMDNFHRSSTAEAFSNFGDRWISAWPKSRASFSPSIVL